MEALPNMRILIIDDNPSLHSDYRKILGPNNATSSSEIDDLEASLFGDKAKITVVADSYQIDSAYQGQDALKMVTEAVAAKAPYAVAFVDMRMPPGWDGVETIEQIWKVDSLMQIVICTAFSDYSWDEIWSRLGKSDRLLILKKPFDPAEVMQLVSALTHKWYLARQADLKLAELEAMVQARTAEITKANQYLEAQIIERENLTIELRNAKEAAEESTRTKSEFLANMSHEIRTPMNGIIGMSELALGTSLNEEQKDYIETVSLSAHSLLRIINDILDFSKAEAGKLKLDPKPFDVRGFAYRVVSLLSPRAKEKELEIVTNIAEDVPTYLIGDELRLGQIIINLFGNAIKFTPQSGGIVFYLWVEKPGQSDNSIIFHGAISDSGIGIAADKLAAVFEPFTQSDASTSRKFGGTGLGLSISKRLTEMMDGAIDGKSTENVGSTFHFTAKLTECDAAAFLAAHVVPKSSEQIASSLTACNILLAEDNLVNQKLVLRILEKRGCKVQIATNGKQVLELIEKHASSAHPFDMILMDSEMPEMSGIEATANIRAMEIKTHSAHIPIIALTAHAMSGDREKFLAAGMDDYVSKPIAVHELISAISRWKNKPSIATEK